MTSDDKLVSDVQHVVWERDFYKSRLKRVVDHIEVYEKEPRPEMRETLLELIKGIAQEIWSLQGEMR